MREHTFLHDKKKKIIIRNSPCRIWQCEIGKRRSTAGQMGSETGNGTRNFIMHFAYEHRQCLRLVVRHLAFGSPRNMKSNKMGRESTKYVTVDVPLRRVQILRCRCLWRPCSTAVVRFANFGMDSKCSALFLYFCPMKWITMIVVVVGVEFYFLHVLR